MSVIRLELSNLRATQRLGELLALQLKPGDVIAMSGALGAGKSALARAVIQAADPSQDEVPSPTFTLVQQYTLANGTPLWHLDLYRIETPEDAMELGLDDAFIDAACLIEWPERLKNFLPKTSLAVQLYSDDSADDSPIRFADITAPPLWADRITDIAACFVRKPIS